MTSDRGYINNFLVNFSTIIFLVNFSTGPFSILDLCNAKYSVPKDDPDNQDLENLEFSENFYNKFCEIKL